MDDEKKQPAETRALAAYEQMKQSIEEQIEHALRPLAARIEELERRVTDLERNLEHERAMRPGLDA